MKRFSSKSGSFPEFFKTLAFLDIISRENL